MTSEYHTLLLSTKHATQKKISSAGLMSYIHYINFKPTVNQSILILNASLGLTIRQGFSDEGNRTSQPYIGQ
jgi:hypothetical protein